MLFRSFAVIAILSAQGCNRENANDDAVGGAGGAGGSSDPALAEPPAPPGDAAAGNGPGRLFAIRRFAIGNATLDGQENSEAWRSFGYDLDDHLTTNIFDELCTPTSGASPNKAFPDGEGGIDNAWGRGLLPIVVPAFGETVPNLESAINEGVGNREAGLLLHLRNLGDQTNYDPIDGVIYEGRRSSAGGWAVARRSLAEPDATPLEAALNSGLMRDAESYVADGTWVFRPSDPDAVLTVRLAPATAASTIELHIHRPVVTMRVPDGWSETTGTIAGILDTEETALESKRIAQRLFGCAGEWYEGIETQVRQTSDILRDGSQDHARTCDGISIGLAFIASETSPIEEIAQTDEADPPPCTP
ncbi:MAG: hypothetical protein HOW73_26825 [Polyangiaceae bacterium]|nr:hypothetical protein [Polyangiaceae bacterium]